MASQLYNVQFRLWALFVAFAALFAILLVRLTDMQILRAGYFDAVAASQRKHASELVPHRGTIYVAEDRGQDLFPVATNQSAWIAFAVPRDLENAESLARELAPEVYAFRERQRARIQTIVDATGQNQKKASEPSPSPEPALAAEQQIAILTEQLYQKFNQKTDPYEPFLRLYEVLDDPFKTFLESRQYKGIVLEEQEMRIYPEKTLAAHVLGYLGWQEDKKVGHYGIEGFFEDTLDGDFGFFSGERDSRGRFIGVAANEFRPAEDGADVVLTIDRVVQSLIEKELKDGVERYGAERGSIVVMDTKTGAIRGMATYPTYDPNVYFAISDPRVQLNPVVSEIFEPGSILKPAIMAAAIAEGKVEPDSTIVDNGPVRVAEYTIDTYDGKHYGTQTMTQVLEQSNNVGMVQVGQMLGHETMYDYLRRFGLGERTGIELEGETQGSLPSLNEWNVTTVATASFGQGVALTPLQAVNAINAIANGGQLMQPYIVSRTRTPDGTEEETEPTVVRSIVTPQAAAQLSAMMVSVIENGVATLAKVPGYYLAGKTGTAQVPDERGKYSPDRKIISFVGFGPFEEPRFTVLIKLDNPAGLSLASGTAAPMFKSIAEKLLNYYQIPPAYDPHQKQPRFTLPPKGEDQGA